MQIIYRIIIFVIIYTMVLYTCSQCSKTFKRKSSFEYHCNRKIKCTGTNYNDPKMIPNDPNAQNNDPKMIPNDPKIQDENKDENNKIECKFCNMKFTFKGNLKRHIDKNCKLKEEIIKKENKIKVLEEKLELLEKTINNTNNTNIITTNNTNNTNTNTNNTMNNMINSNNTNINIVNFGQERISKLTEEEELKIIEGGANSIANHVSLVHFNKRLPEYMNVYNTNLRGNTCDVYYNGKWKKYKVKKIIDTLITNGVIDIQDLLIKYNNIHNFSVKCTREIVQDIENHNKKQIKEQNDRISTILYNEKDKPLQNKK